ncbi:MAG: TetR/AcrR family transcriptional regulator [Deltaproteobacteria bacterium]|nr:TetR/AcrR family transcriptional regulator [Deltaproteobacteria bacterium]MBW2382937.1 TetR/AcrR family transcriptional regulator [Deltaproteobacteria bacterium]
MSNAGHTGMGGAGGTSPTATTTAGRGAHSDLRPDDGRLVRGRRSRACIRAAARELFRERGFDGATLRAIAERAGMGASSIYRHVQSKEELLVEELAELQEEAWRRFRADDNRQKATRARVHCFLDVQHALLEEDRDLTMIALRSITKPEARVARHVLALNDRTIGLLMEILQMGRMRKDLARDVDVLEAARVVFNITQGARIPWANGLVSADACREAIQTGVDLLFRGVEAPTDAARGESVTPRKRGGNPGPPPAPR